MQHTITVNGLTITMDFPDELTTDEERIQHYLDLANQPVEEYVPTAEEILQQKINAIADKVSNILDNEAKKNIYYYGLGFSDGMLSVAKYPNNSDATKLSNWAEACWQVVATKLGEIQAGMLDIDTVDNEYINTNLPNVEDF